MSLLSYIPAIALGSVSAAAPRKLLRGAALALALVLVLGGASYGSHAYWTVGRFLKSTTNAYVRADYTIVAPKISGYITRVLVQDNAPVNEGEVVAVIDERDFRVMLDQAKADVDVAEAALRNLDAKIAQHQSALDHEKAGVSADQALLSFAEADYKRYKKLKKTGYGSVQRAQQAETTMREKSAELEKSRANLTLAERQVDVLQSERNRLTAHRERAAAAYHQAELNLSYTSIAAPMSGVVGARALRVGQYVQSGTPLMAVVPLHSVYVVANYKETQLARVRPGQPVEIVVDSFPDVVLRGHVDSVSPASGQEFSLLPADNATGNFIKIVQRVPVKIMIDDNPLEGRLRPGMSVEATIDTRKHR